MKHTVSKIDSPGIVTGYHGRLVPSASIHNLCGYEHWHSSP